MDHDREARRVTRAIKLALSRIAEQDPELALFLRETIKTGAYLWYSPASALPTPPWKPPRAKKTPRAKGRKPIKAGGK